MSWDGMLPKGITCKKCGVELNADGDHPAELYLGTYTGLCYRCERSGPYISKRYTDGAMRVSHPPSCPSHRRDRVEHIAYEDCDVCNGKGCTYVSRSLAQGGGYNHYCEKCSSRYSNHPDRLLAGELHKMSWDMVNAAFNRAIRSRFKIPKRKKRIVLTDEQKQEMKGVSDVLWGIHKTLIEITNNQLLTPLEVQDANQPASI